MRYLTCPAVVLVVLCACAAARAEPRAFTLSFTGSGIVGSTPFNNAAAVITGYGDTADRIADGTLYSITLSRSTISIDGIGSGDFTIPTRVFCNNLSPAAGFGRVTTPANDILDMDSEPFRTWDMLNPIGPVFDATLQPVSQAKNLGTTLGTLSFTAYSNGTFTAAAVPEPAAVFTTAGGFAALATRRCRRNR